MSTDFIAQPSGTFRIGDFLQHGFANALWTEFRAAIAFVKRSGTKHIRGALEAFTARGAAVRISAGIDAGGTSVEGLSDLSRGEALRAWGRIADALASSESADDRHLAHEIRGFVRRQPVVQAVLKQRQREVMPPQQRLGPDIVR